MTGETGQLQQLTDEQVKTRLAAYNRDGSLDRDMRLLKDHVLDLVVAEVKEQFGSERADRYAAIYNGRVDAAWIQSIAEYGRQIYREKILFPEYIGERNEIATRLVAGLTETFASDCEQLAACMAAFYRFDIIETDIILAQV